MADKDFEPKFLDEDLEKVNDEILCPFCKHTYDKTAEYCPFCGGDNLEVDGFNKHKAEQAPSKPALNPQVQQNVENSDETKEIICPYCGQRFQYKDSDVATVQQYMRRSYRSYEMYGVKCPRCSRLVKVGDDGAYMFGTVVAVIGLILMIVAILGLVFR